MAIPLTDQTSLMDDPAFLARVQSASVKRAITAFDDTANTDTTVQKKRIYLSRAVLDDPTKYLNKFAWWVVTRDGLNSVDDLASDTTVLNNLVTTAFDKIASIIIPDILVP